MLEIDRLGDRRLGGKQLLGVARWRRQERDAPARRDGGNGADEGQVPDDVADAGFHLDDGGSRVTLIVVPAKVAICAL